MWVNMWVEKKSIFAYLYLYLYLYLYVEYLLVGASKMWVNMCVEKVFAYLHNLISSSLISRAKII